MCTESAEELPSLEAWMKQTIKMKLKEVDGQSPTWPPKSSEKWWPGVQQGGDSVRADLHTWYILNNLCIIIGLQEILGESEDCWSQFLFLQLCCEVSHSVGEKAGDGIHAEPTHWKDTATYLQRFCTLLKDQVQILNANGFWTGKSIVIWGLRKDPFVGDLQHLQTCFSLGPSVGH